MEGSITSVMSEGTNVSKFLFGVYETRFSAPVGLVGGVPVVGVRGEIDLATVPELLDAIGEACSWMNGRPLVFVDLRHARFVDVYGARKLLEQTQAMHELGGELRLVVPEGGPVARTLELLKAGEVVRLYRKLDPSESELATRR